MIRISTTGRCDAARKGWETRKANEASRARRFDEVLEENRKLKAAARALLDNIDEFGLDAIDERYQALADLVWEGE